MFPNTNHDPQQAHTTPTYAIQRMFQALAFPLSISIVHWKHLDARKINADISMTCCLQKYYSIKVYFSEILSVFSRNTQTELNKEKYRLQAEHRNKTNKK